MYFLQAFSLKSHSDPLILCSNENERIFSESGFREFDDLWNAPREFVDDVNYRRHGWSAVSLLTLADGRGGKRQFYLKRQENQKRYSWRHFMGALTFQYEIEALEKARGYGLPGADLAAYGFRRMGSKRQGLVVTAAIDEPAFASYERNPPDWSACLPQLEQAGAQLLRFHQLGWQHGALYPVHLFINLDSGSTHLIDFERTRMRASPLKAAEADFTQFLKRSVWLAPQALSALLRHYQTAIPDLLPRLQHRFPNRFPLTGY